MRHAAILLTAVMGAGIGACSVPEKQQFPPFDCYQHKPPATAQDPITIQGTVFDPIMNTGPISGATVELFVNGNADSSVTTATDGSFAFPNRRTGGTPFSMYLKASKASANPDVPNIDTYYYPPAIITEDLEEIELQFITAGQAMLFASSLVPTITPDQTLILLAVTVTNCNHEPQALATVLTDPPATALQYLMDTPQGPSPGSTMVTDPQVGTALAVFTPTQNAPVPSVTVSATMPSATNALLTFPGHSIKIPQAGALIQTDVDPQLTEP